MSEVSKNEKWLEIFGKVFIGIGALRLILAIVTAAMYGQFIGFQIAIAAVMASLYVWVGRTIWKGSKSSKINVLWIIIILQSVAFVSAGLLLGANEFFKLLASSFFVGPIVLMGSIISLAKAKQLPDEDGEYSDKSPAINNGKGGKFYQWSLFSVALVAILLINIISSLTYLRFDMTADQRYSLAEGTVDFLDETSQLNSRLNIKIYLEGNLPADLQHFRNAIEDKLIEFKQYAGDRIEYQFINPNVGTEEEQQELFQEIFAEGNGILPMDIAYMEDAAQKQMMLWPGGIIEYGSGQGSKRVPVQLLPGSKTGRPFQLKQMADVIQNSINNLEYMLISSLRRATQEKKPRIAFLHGHGELSFAQTQRCRSLITPYFSVADVTIKDSLAALDDLDGLIIARPRGRFSDKELFIIDQFLMRGGRLMCFMDKLDMPEDTLMRYGQTHTTRYKDLRLDDMIFDYGLKLNANYVMDARCVPKRVPFAQQSMVPWFFHVMSSPTDHPISRNVEPVALEYTGEVQLLPGQNPNVALTPILTSSTNSAVTGSAPLVNLALPLNYGENPKLAPNPDSEANKKCLAAIAEGKFDSYFKNRIVDAYAKNPNVKILEESEKEGKVFLIGNGRFIENAYDSMPNRTGTGYMYRPKQINDLQFSEELINMNIPHFFGNQEFFQNLTDYMMGESSVLDIRSRQIDIHEIDKEKVKENASYYKVLNIGLPVVVILVLAIALNYLRRRKYAR